MADPPGFGDSPEFLGFGAFETAGFFSAILVALYSLLRNPEGVQGEDDKAEYDVYVGWRRAITIVLIQVVLMVAVSVYISVNGATGEATWWVVALMLAPWAPFTGKVRNTLFAWRRVRYMMRSRVTRNELAAVVRDRFLFGQRALVVARVVNHAYKLTPVLPLQSLRQNTALRSHEDALRVQAENAMEVKGEDALPLGILWTVDQGPQPADISCFDLISRLYFSRVDVLAWRWTNRRFKLPCSPFPVMEPTNLGQGDEARILDVIDTLQEGGTISEKHMQRAMQSRHCELCRLATRGAVEAFMESSFKSHSDIRVARWLRHIEIDWRGKYERIVNIMFEAVFMGDARGDYAPTSQTDIDHSRDFGNRQKVTTTKTFALFWTITRSLFGNFGEPDAKAAFQKVQDIIVEGMHTRKWWDDYWNSVAELHGYDPMTPGVPVVIDESSPAKFKEALRLSVDKDINAIVAAMVASPISSALCGDQACELSGNTRFQFKTCSAPASAP